MRQTTVRFVLAVFVTASGVGAGESFAQIGYSAFSIEWLTAGSDVAVRATVVDLAYKDCEPLKGEAKSQYQWVTVTLKVQATLKGKEPKTIAFVLHQFRGGDPLPGWKKSEQSVLWFLVDSGDKKEELPRDFPPQPEGKLRPLGLWTSTVVLGSPKTKKRVPQPMFSMDFQVFDDEDKILEAVKAEVASERDPSKKRARREIHICIPYDLAIRSGQAGDANTLTVPVNDRLERLGRGWVRSKDAFRRDAGIATLGQFKSAANIAILKGMLAEGERDFIREAAYKALQKWGVAVPKPKPQEGREAPVGKNNYLLLSAPVHPDHGKGGEIVTPADIKWQDGPASLPVGAKMVVLEGDPSKKGKFVMRIKLRDGFRVMPHTHPRDERVTVISGTLYLGDGGKFDEKATKAVPAGSYARTAAGMKHFGWVKGETVLQLHGEGPWTIEYVDPKDDPRKGK